MTYFFKSKIFNIPALDPVGTIYPCEGFGFQPKAILIFWNGRPELITTVGRRNLNGGMGAATSPTNRGCCSVFDTDAAATMTGGGRIDNTGVAQRNDAGGLATASLDFDSFTADGVKLIVDNDLSTSMNLKIMAWGGTDITNVEVLPFRWGAALGNQDIHGLSFDPGADSLFLFFGMPSILADPPSADEDVIQLMFGAARSETPVQQYVMVGKQDDDNASSLCKSYVQHGECLASIDGPGTTSPDARASFVGTLSDGFTINVLEHTPATASSSFVLVLKGGKYHLGDVTTTNGNTAEVNVTGMSFKPEGVTGLTLAGPDGGLEPASDTTLSGWRMGFGSATSNADQASLGLIDLDGQASASITTGVHYTRWLTGINGFAPVFGTLWSFIRTNSDGFTFQADGGYIPCFLWYIAYGPSGAGPEPPVVTPADTVDGTREPLIIGDYHPKKATTTEVKAPTRRVKGPSSSTPTSRAGKPKKIRREKPREIQEVREQAISPTFDASGASLELQAVIEIPIRPSMTPLIVFDVPVQMEMLDDAVALAIGAPHLALEIGDFIPVKRKSWQL
ncbi:hypothetical protein [Glutamicibacter sp.]|uniref:hypothetical protein n=1 Tax=Glutamicibacter sp. TaxID=1931995 RepID=UPI002FD9D9D3